MNCIFKYLFVFCFCLAPISASAEFKLYSIDSVYSAPFPDQPIFNGEVGNGSSKHRSYKYTDKENMIFYTATYQVNTDKFNKNIIDKAIRYYIDGSAKGGGGNIIAYVSDNLGGNNGARYVIQTAINGGKINRYGVVIYQPFEKRLNFVPISLALHF